MGEETDTERQEERLHSSHHDRFATVRAFPAVPCCDAFLSALWPGPGATATSVRRMRRDVLWSTRLLARSHHSASQRDESCCGVKHTLSPCFFYTFHPSQHCLRRITPPERSPDFLVFRFCLSAVAACFFHLPSSISALPLWSSPRVRPVCKHGPLTLFPLLFLFLHLSPVQPTSSQSSPSSLPPASSQLPSHFGLSLCFCATTSLLRARSRIIPTIQHPSHAPLRPSIRTAAASAAALRSSVLPVQATSSPARSPTRQLRFVPW